jgi:hypothetical protein
LSTYGFLNRSSVPPSKNRAIYVIDPGRLVPNVCTLTDNSPGYVSLILDDLIASINLSEYFLFLAVAFGNLCLNSFLASFFIEFAAFDKALLFTANQSFYVK